MSRRPRERVFVLGCPVDRFSPSALRAQLPAIATGDRFTHLVTLNPEQVMQARSHADVRAIIAAADIVTADGVGITTAIRLQGERPPERITGVDLVDWIAELSMPVFFLGGAEGVARTAAEHLAASHPATRVVGVWSGGTPESVDDGETLRRIAESGARVLSVAYGAPAQLRWIERNRERLFDAGIRLAIGVGGALDYHAGEVRRPPRVVRRLGLEWLARLVLEPWRWRRQLVLPIYAVLVSREAIRIRLGRQ